MTMAKPMQLGHTNIRVSNLARSEAFYTEAIGLGVVSRRENGVNLSAREHSQEIVLREITSNDREQDIKSVGSNLLAWEITSFDDLQNLCDQLVSQGIEVFRVRSNSYSGASISTIPTAIATRCTSKTSKPSGAGLRKGNTTASWWAFPPDRGESFGGQGGLGPQALPH